MLATAQRLRRRADFQAAARAGARAGRGSVVVHLHLSSGAHLPPGAEPSATRRSGTPARSPVVARRTASSEPARTTAPLAPARAGFVVPRAVGGAVVRNRVRRRLRHLVRERLAALPDGVMLVVRAMPGAGAATYYQLGLDLDAALTAARARWRPRSPGGLR